MDTQKKVILGQSRTTAIAVSNTNDRIAMALMVFLGIGSLGVCVDAALHITYVPAGTIAVEVWRMFGYAVFAGLFFLLAIFPRRMTGIWELVLFHKAGTALFLTPYIGLDAGLGASVSHSIKPIVLNDVMLVVVTAIAYILAKGWQAWDLSWLD
jgi:hypothetical protein